MANRQIREHDPDALRTARLLWDECASCHREPSNVHHVVPKGAPYFGDDCIANFVLLCGTGTWRCHGAFHGSPYVDDRGRRWTEDEVRRAIGKTIATTRPDTVAYVKEKLGDVAGRDYLERRYLATLEDA